MDRLELLDSFSRIETLANYSTRQYNRIQKDHGTAFVDDMISLPDFEFRSRFRMNKSTFEQICSKVILINFVLI